MRRLLSLGVVVMILSACARGGPSTFTAEFPADRERELDAMEVSLVDQTGLVTGIAIATPDGARDGPVVRAQPNVDHELRVSWPGEGCDRRITLVFGELGSGYELAIHVDPTAAGGLACPDITVERGLAITFSQVVDPTTVTITRPFP